jgi:acyl-CoA reductase-like NAD-dependent aldehyde dehydrogenase/nicotinamidase-related amidase
VTAALLLVDLQHDFLRRPGVQPAPDDLVARTAELLEGCRARGLIVIHARTRTSRGGSDRMPHWVAAGTSLCVEGDTGEAPPPALAERDGEAVVRKRFFSAFETPALDTSLRATHVDELIVAGIYLHGCVRATVLDAYARGLRVTVVRDAVGSSEVLHAEITRDYLHGRAAAFASTREVLARLDGDGSASATADEYVHVAPARREAIVARVRFADATDIAVAVRSALNAAAGWNAVPIDRRVAALGRWRDALEARHEAIVAEMVREVGKPVVAAREEFGRALRHIDSTLRRAGDALAIAAGVEAAFRPLGVVALVTPWNNPVAIPVAKLAAALVQGNAIVWKPASQSTRCAALILEALRAAIDPIETVGMLHGDAECVRELVIHPAIAAVSMTGSEAAGEQVRALCAIHGGKPLQAELGGNNAAIVLADADLDAAVAALVTAAYSYSGQRCTAIRRLIVEAPVAAGLRERWCAATARLKVGEPEDENVEVGPLISERQLLRVERAVDRARAAGARCLVGGGRVRGRSQGWWFEPTLLECDDARADIVQQETFGPVAVLQVARDAAHAVELANAVPQGLLGAVFTRDPDARRRIGDALQVGILRLSGNIQAIEAEAPFGGWKSSQVGPPEHGAWDRHFFSRPQARYGDSTP